MTNPVIENVRQALGRTALTPMSPRPVKPESRQAASTEVEIERFLGEVKKLSGVGIRLSPNEIASSLATLIADQNIRKATLWHTAYLRQLGIADCLSTLGVEVISANADKHEMAGCDLGVTEVDFVLPETGTIALLASLEKPRAVSLLPRVHLAVVTPVAFRPDMHQVFAEAKNSHYLVFITGPSRTADIELTVTLGVHGPRNLYVWMMKE